MLNLHYCYNYIVKFFYFYTATFIGELQLKNYYGHNHNNNYYYYYY